MLAILVAALAAAQVNLPGTQPNELGLPPEPSSSCNCHLTFAPETFTEPGQTYKATAMALSGRDPLFRAALKIAHDDRPDAADLCIRCHVPIGWLSGRSTPGDGSILTDDDLESVSCDMCHRQVPTPDGPQLIGSGQYTISPLTTKRARRGNRPENGHEVEVSDFVGSSEMCGTCHSLFNPLEPAYDANAQPLGHPYYEQRTYEEWKDSAFSARGQSCASCHLKKVTGRAARQANFEYPDLAQHAIVGGNDFVPRALAMFDPFVEIQQELPFIVAAVEETLRSAVKLEVTTATTSQAIEALGGDTVDFGVRLTNLTGHKLPTGYPEGRRVYLQLSLTLNGRTTPISGEWDPLTGSLMTDPQLRTYETEHGRVENGVGVRTRHLIRMNQIMSDTRIPPEGFVPRAPDMAPSGRDYGSTAPYRHFDEHTYAIVLPDVVVTSTGTITVRARYMLTDGEVVSFLVENAGPTSTEAINLTRAWEALDKLPPKIMAEVNIPITVYVRPPPPPDAGVIENDAGRGDEPDPIGGGGCSCQSQRSPESQILVLGLLAVLMLPRRKRVR